MFNGLGARGILNGNYFSINLYHHLENGEEIHPEVDFLKDFNKKSAIVCGFLQKEGFEPSIQLPVYYLSRVAPSTTRTPFFQMAKVEFILQFPKFLHADFS